MSLRLGFDLDGVFADLGARLNESSERRTDPKEEDDGSDPGSEAAASRRSVSINRPFQTPHLRGASARVWSRLTAIENFWETLEEIEPGSVRALATLAHERRWEVIFLTSRPDSRGDAVQVQSQRWLADKGFPLPSVFVTRGSRGRIAAALALDLVVDDNPENCLDVATESEARAILVWRGAGDVVPPSARKLGVGAVSTMAECLSVLDTADRTPGSDGGFLGVFRRLLRLGNSY